ncbi:MAG: nicotinate-nucleotide diphosphorylase (carboxylating) [Candidatus Marinimicrobia bacterium]|nr:nicotinate-nucleotide diphosphorylase (carboxylating) [Candidatus Neomarinimicrobiota bacterium]|tara:strand:+ start:34212 stop:35078 length:867 start_codon:yes stop_codon:yes gene_type:complete
MIRHRQIKRLDPQFVKEKLENFFIEDQAHKDLTTLFFTKSRATVQANLVAKEKLIFAGREIIQQGFSNCLIETCKKDGEALEEHEIIAEIKGPFQAILSRERVVLNLLQRLSGIASKTKKLVQYTKPQNIQLLDTRKTTPGLREFEKFAVCVGGGTNHRNDLSESMMIKDNHLIENINIIKTTKEAKQKHQNTDIEIEVDTIEQLEVALNSSATSILLDNFKPKKIKKLIEHIRAHPKGNNKYIEISGGITEKKLKDFCIFGINGISMGALTHHIKSKDISLEIQEYK